MSFSRIHNSNYLCRQSTNESFSTQIVIDVDQWQSVDWCFSSSLWFTKFRKLTFPLPNVADTVLQPEQAWTKRRCSLSSKFEQALAILYAVSVFFVLKMISDISPFQWYRSIFAMSVSLATTITGLSLLGEKRLIVSETTVCQHLHHTGSLLGRLPPSI